MVEKIKGSFYTATIDKSEVVASDGTILDFRIDISCENGDLLKELIEYIELFHGGKNSDEIIKNKHNCLNCKYLDIMSDEPLSVRYDCFYPQWEDGHTEYYWDAWEENDCIYFKQKDDGDIDD